MDQLSELLKEFEGKDRLVTATTAAKMLCIKPQTLAAWRHRGYPLPWVRLGGRAVRYKVSDLVKFIEDRRQH